MSYSVCFRKSYCDLEHILKLWRISSLFGVVCISSSTRLSLPSFLSVCTQNYTTTAVWWAQSGLGVQVETAECVLWDCGKVTESAEFPSGFEAVSLAWNQSTNQVISWKSWFMAPFLHWMLKCFKAYLDVCMIDQHEITGWLTKAWENPSGKSKNIFISLHGQITGKCMFRAFWNTEKSWPLRTAGIFRLDCSYKIKYSRCVNKAKLK